MIFKDLYDRHFKFDFTWLVCVFCFGFLKTTIFSLMAIFNFWFGYARSNTKVSWCDV